MRLKSILDKIFKLTIISSVFCLLFGILGLFNTNFMIDIIVLFMGCILVFVGLFIVFKYFADDFIKSLLGYSLLYGLLDILAGIMLLFNPSLLVLIISVFVASNLFIEFVTKLQLSILLKKYNIKGWMFEIILSIVLLFCVILIIFNPAIVGNLITKFISISIIVSSILNIIDCIVVKKKIKNTSNILKDLLY